MGVNNISGLVNGIQPDPGSHRDYREGPLKIIIIGNGITGVTAALTIRDLQPDWDITIVSAESDHFFSRTALMYIYMGHMRLVDTQPYAPDMNT